MLTVGWKRWKRSQLATLCCGLLWAALLAQPAAGAGADTSPAKIELRECWIAGRVIGATTGEPIPGLEIILAGRDQPPPTTTDTEGRFQFGSLGAYRYGVSLSQQSGYVARMSIVDLRAAQKVTGIEIKAFKPTVVSGRVLDARRRPVDGVRVSVLSLGTVWGYLPQSRLSVVETNDVGEYRITGIRPGRYRLLAEKTAVEIHPKMSDDNPDSQREPIEADVSTFFPNSSSPEGGELFTIGVGQILEGMDITLAREKTVCVRSMVISADARNAAPVEIRLNAGGRNAVARGEIPRGSGFDVCGLGPGTYNLSAAVDGGTVEGRYASQEFTVTKLGVRLPDLNLQPLLRISGRLRIDDAQGDKVPLSGPVRVELMSSSGLGAVGQELTAVVGQEGPFVIPAVYPTNYRLRVDPPAGFYVKSASMGGVDSLRAPIHPEGGELSILLGKDGATLTVQVADDKSQPVPGAFVVLGRSPLPSPCSSGDLLLSMTGETGQVVFSGVAPGVYRLLADIDSWEGADLLSPESFLARETESERIELSAREIRKVQVKAPHAEQRN